MPRIEKVRITGVQYDKMRKHYENTIFDFLNEEEPQHTLLTLVNGGGKGMLLQMIFQTMMPLTTWGKHGENHIDALFYNEKLQFEPYTFHVAIEWRLDTEPTEWLVAGICITSERKFGQDTEETDTEPQYFLYTSKYRKPSKWNLDTLPFYEEETGSVVPYEGWEEWLKKRKQDFQFFSKSKQSAYYQYLSSYGIERSEWRHMKEINRDEGGIEHYFKKGLDNFGLFHNLIIPEISNYLEEDQEENLFKIFKDNSIIAQKLPLLLKRESAYQLINDQLLPIQKVLEEGRSIEFKWMDHQEYANYLYYGMEEKRHAFIHEQHKWELEQEKTKEIRAELHWEKDNLDYAKECQTFAEVSEQLQEAEVNAASLEEKLNDFSAQKKNLEIDIAYHEYIHSTDELQSIETQIKKLEKKQDIQDEKEQAEKMEQQLAETWESVKEELLEDVEKYNALENSYQKKLDSLKKQVEQLDQEAFNLKSKVGTYTDYIQSHNQKAVSMVQRYGDHINRNPEFVLSKHEKKSEEVEQILKSIKQQMDELYQKQLNNKKLEGTLDGEYARLSEGLKESTKNKDERRKKEQEFHQMWCRYYKEDKPFIVYSTAAWKTAEEQMISEVNHLRKKLDNMKKEYWNHQLDTSLVNDSYWIPNNDVRKVVQRLEELGIQATYGTELINELMEEDRISYLERFPMLAYGIVIHEKDLEKEIDQADFKEMLFHSPVPIFIRERMNQDFPYPFEIPNDQGIKMAFNKENWLQWKETLEERTDKFQVDLQQAESRGKEADHVFDAIKQLNQLTYDVYEERVAEWEGKLSEFEEKQRKLREEDTLLKMQQEELVEREGQLNQKRDSLQKKLIDIQNWVEAHEKYQNYQKLKEDVKKNLSIIENRVREEKQDLDDTSGEFDRWRKMFDRWKYHREQEVKELKAVLPEIEFPTTTMVFTGERVQPQCRDTLFNGVKPILKRWESIQLKIQNADSELVKWNTKLDYQKSDQREKKGSLSRLCANWHEREIPHIPKSILEEQLKVKTELVKNTEIELNDANGNIHGFNGQLKILNQAKQSQENRILEKHRKPAEAWKDIDLSEKQREINENLKKVKEDLFEQEKIITKLTNVQQQLQNQQHILKSHITLLKQIGEIPAQVKDQVKDNPDQMVRQWIEQNKRFTQSKEEFRKTFKDQLKQLSLVMQNEQMDAPLRQNINQLIPQLESDSIVSSIQIVASVIEHIQKEMLKLKNDKQKSEDAQEVWVSRAVYRVITIMQSLKQMVNKMKIKNKEGHNFPLVEIERLNELLGTEEEEYRRLLREHFTITIETLLENEEAIENLTDAQLKKYINDSQLVLVSLRNRYPTLSIYKPQTTNAFLYEKPRKHHYATWETLNKGSKVEAKGSGGQLLAARTIIMMMIMTFKRQENSSNWSVLITDNPFGQAVSAHVLDPIFSIADTLKFQWVVLAPPELIKLDVSRRFPVYWKLELHQQKQGEVMKEVLQHGGRTFEDAELSLF
ncbi:hypothetical protein ACJ2A9_19585 [Anaerobacillus sp. MEB173]|uniref:hypothetical protein n=1 Tax=Anaerobacillus sp. MEB173 TaxID=3383345 RepID=UPI003F8DB86B